MKRASLLAALMFTSLILLAACSKAAKEEAPTPSPAPAVKTTEPAPAPAAASPASDKVYVCPMGCEVSDHPGKCSKCGMELKEENRADVAFVCPVCGFKAAQPGACPKDHTMLTLKIAGKTL